MSYEYGRIAAVFLSASAETELLCAVSATEYVGVVSFCNQLGEVVDIYFAHTDASGAAADEDYRVYGLPLGPQMTVEFAVAMKGGEYLRVKCDTASAISCVFEGVTKT